MASLSTDIREEVKKQLDGIYLELEEIKNRSIVIHNHNHIQMGSDRLADKIIETLKGGNTGKTNYFKGSSFFGFVISLTARRCDKKWPIQDKVTMNLLLKSIKYHT